MDRDAVTLRRALVKLREDGTLERVVALEIEGKWGRALYWSFGHRAEDVEGARFIPGDEMG